MYSMLAAYCLLLTAFLLLLLLLLVVGYLTFGYFGYFWLRVREFEFKILAFWVGNE